MKLLLKEIRNIRYDQRQLIAVVNEMRTFLMNTTTTDTVPMSVSFEGKYLLQLPFTTHKQFIEFDTKLSEDAQCRSAFVSIDVFLTKLEARCGIKCSLFIFRYKHCRESLMTKNQ